MMCWQRRAELVDKVSGFWPTVLVCHAHLSELISEEDEEALQSLRRVEVHEFDDIKSGYKIDFVSRLFCNYRMTTLPRNSFKFLESFSIFQACFGEWKFWN